MTGIRVTWWLALASLAGFLLSLALGAIPAALVFAGLATGFATVSTAYMVRAFLRQWRGGTRG